MKICETSSPPETLPPPPKRFGKKLYLIAGLIAVIAVVSAVTFIFLLPSTGEGAPVPLGLNYTPGEEMTYSMTITTSGTGVSRTDAGITSMEILNFDGENYTMELNFQTLTPSSGVASYTIKMDKTGRIIEYSGFSPEMEFFMFAGIPGCGSYFQKDQVNVGESFQTPIYISSVGFRANVSIDGTANHRISEIKNTTIPNCGTYRVFKTEIAADNIILGDESSGTAASLHINIDGYMYLEYGTCRLIEYNVQESVIFPYMGQPPIIVIVTMQLRLTEHVKP